MEGQAIISEKGNAAWQRQVIKSSTGKTKQKQARSRVVPLSTVIIDTGARRYGLPADAKERRM